MADKIYLKGTFGFREDTKENWERVNPILERGEPAVVRDAVDENWLKIGDGVTHWADLPWKKGPKGERGPKGEGIGLDTEVGGAIFNDYENNQAGLKAFSITNVSQTDKIATITLDSVEGLEVNDKVSALISPNTYDHFGYITAIDESNNKIIISIYDDGLILVTTVNSSSTLWIPAKPYIGTKVYGEYGFAANVNSKASAKAAAAFGESNIAGSKRAFVAGGEENFAGYCCTVGGQNVTVRGVRSAGFGHKNDGATTAQYAFVVGQNNKVCSNGTFVEGVNNTDGYQSATGANHIEGSGNTIGNGSYGKIHIEGENNQVLSDGQATHVEGKGNIVETGKVNHIQGQNNIIKSGSINDVCGNSNTVAGSTNIVGGSSNKVNATSARVNGTNNIVGEWDGTTPITDAKASAVYVKGYGNIVKSGAKNIIVSGFINEIGAAHSGEHGNEGYTDVQGGYHILNDGYGMFNHIEGKSHTTKGLVTNCHLEGAGHKLTNEPDAEGKPYDLNAVHISGYRNQVTNSKYAEVWGQENILTNGQASFVGGVRNTVNGHAQVIMGNDNTVTGSNNFFYAYNSSIDGSNNRALVYNSVIKGKGNVALGFNLKTDESTEYQVVLGDYNTINNDAKLIIGVGKDNSNRANGFMVMKDGSARIQTASTEDDAAVRYSQIKPLFEKIAQLEEKIAQLEYEISALKGGE